MLSKALVLMLGFELNVGAEVVGLGLLVLVLALLLLLVLMLALLVVGVGVSIVRDLTVNVAITFFSFHDFYRKILTVICWETLVIITWTLIKMG